VKPRTSATKGGIAIPSVWSHPAGFILATQQSFYERISAAMSGMRSGSSWAAAWTLMLLSLGYGVFHAAGPGHGKTVITGWLLATEQELRRGIIVSFTSAIIQACTAIIIVSTLLLLVHAVGSSARSVASVLEAASYGMITLLGFYLLWQGMRHFWPVGSSEPRLQAAEGHSHEHGHDHHSHHHAGHDHTHHDHMHDESCGHNHMPSARDVAKEWSLAKALSISLAVGIRPCTGAILALLFANAIHLYWAGVAATFVMALGTALTVSAIAILAVFSKRTALRLVGRKQAWLDWSAFLLRIAGGIVIAALGATLFLASIQGYATAG
jgi:ABC-type nickel/cobalt efflux system permease component RcnA